MKPTELLYLDDTYLNKCEAEVLKIEEVEGEEGLWSLNCDQTVFYPQGGGQCYDQGWVRFVAENRMNSELSVEKVYLDKETSVVNHYVRLINGELMPEVGSTIEMEVNMDRRLLMSDYHTVGHMIDLVAAEGLIPGLDRAYKGDHNPDSAYVKFKDRVDLSDLDYVAEFQVHLQGLKVRALDIIAVEHKGEVEGAPKGKTYREVYFAGAEDKKVGCGGTHIHNTSEVGDIEIVSIKSKKGGTTVKYEVS
jgi:alanyl-tRNA synthetase